MATTYTKCDDSVAKMVKAIASKNHRDLLDAGVTWNMLFASGDGESPAISHGGYPALAQVKIVSLKDRVAGLADATLLIDEEAWRDGSDEQRAALIDHELTHVLVVKNLTGRIKEDDCGRPRLKIRLHDWHGGGFMDVVERNGLAAPEARMIEDVHAKFEQASLFAEA